MRAELLTAVEQNNAISWPFLKPVDPQLALDYYDVIIDPIDLSLMRSRLGCQQYYVSLEMFVADMRKMCDNCRWVSARSMLRLRRSLVSAQHLRRSACKERVGLGGCARCWPISYVNCRTMLNRSPWSHSCDGGHPNLPSALGLWPAHAQLGSVWCSRRQCWVGPTV